MQANQGSLGVISSDTPQDPSETNSPTFTNLDLTENQETTEIETSLLTQDEVARFPYEIARLDEMGLPSDLGDRANSAFIIHPKSGRQGSETISEEGIHIKREGSEIIISSVEITDQRLSDRPKFTEVLTVNVEESGNLRYQVQDAQRATSAIARVIQEPSFFGKAPTIYKLLANPKSPIVDQLESQKPELQSISTDNVTTVVLSNEKYFENDFDRNSKLVRESSQFERRPNPSQRQEIRDFQNCNNAGIALDYRYHRTREVRDGFHEGRQQIFTFHRNGTFLTLRLSDPDSYHYDNNSLVRPGFKLDLNTNRPEEGKQMLQELLSDSKFAEELPNMHRLLATPELTEQFLNPGGSESEQESATIDHSIVANESSTFGKRDMDKYEALISAKASEDPEDHSITYAIFDRHGISMRAAMKAPVFTATFNEGTITPTLAGDSEKVSDFVERLIADPEFIEQYPEMDKMLRQVKASATGEGLTVAKGSEMKTEPEKKTGSEPIQAQTATEAQSSITAQPQAVNPSTLITPVQPQVAAEPSLDDTFKSDIMNSGAFDSSDSNDNQGSPVQPSTSSQVQTQVNSPAKPSAPTREEQRDTFISDLSRVNSVQKAIENSTIAEPTKPLGTDETVDQESSQPTTAARAIPVRGNQTSPIDTIQEFQATRAQEDLATTTTESSATIPNTLTDNPSDLLDQSLDSWGFESADTTATNEILASTETQEQPQSAESSMTDEQMLTIPFEIRRLTGTAVAMNRESVKNMEQEGVSGQILPAETTDIFEEPEQLEPAVNIRVLPYEPMADILDTGAPETFIFSSESSMELFRITVSQDRPIEATNIDTRVRDIKIETETGQEATTARVLKRLTENPTLFALAPNLHRLLADPSHKLYSQINVFDLDGQEVYPRSIKNSEFIVGTEDEIEYRTKDFNRDIGESRTTKLTSQPFRQMYSGILNELKAIADEQLPEGIIRNSSGIHCDFRRHGVETIHEGNRETRQDILTFYRNGEVVTLRIAAIQNRQGGQATNARISLESSTSKDPSLPYMYNLIGTLLRDITFTRSHPTLVNLLNAFDERRQKERSESQKNNPNARRRSDWI